MSVSPDRRFLYVGTRGEPKVAAGFASDPSTGKLKFVASGPLADSLAYIATDRTGRFLLGASYPGHRVTVNPIGSPGKVLPPQEVLENYPNAHSIFADGANRFVLVPTLGNDHINRVARDATTGKLTPTASPADEARPNAGPRHFVYHPGGKLVYVIGELDGNVYVFDYNAASGDLMQKQVVSALPAGFQGKPSAADLHITPDGKFLYGSERTTSTLAGFQVDPAKGTLTKSLAEGRATLGYRVTTPSVQIAQALARTGVDWLMIDTEHAPVGIESVAAMIAATGGTPATPIVRVPAARPELVKPVLDCGALGVVFPQIATRQEAEATVQAVRYAPKGQRGYGPTYAALRWGLPNLEYLRSANDAVLNVVLIESLAGVDTLDDILSVSGLDVV